MKIARNLAVSGRSGEWYSPSRLPLGGSWHARKGVTEGVSSDGCSGPMVIRKPLLALKFLNFYVHRSTLPQSRFARQLPQRGSQGAGAIQPGARKPWGVRAIFIAPTEAQERLGFTVHVAQTQKSPAYWRDFLFCVGITYLPGKSPCKYCRRR